MDLIRVAKVPDVQLIRRGVTVTGTLHLTTHHLIFSAPNTELWVCYPIIHTLDRRPNFGGMSALRLRCRDFVFVTFNFTDEGQANDVFESVKALCCKATIESMYAFFYTPGKSEAAQNGWGLWDPVKEYQRLGVGSQNPNWRITNVNKDYTFSPTYPAVLAVPACISDNVLQYASKYRSKTRVPALTYLHSVNGCSITRSSQPMVGLKQARSIQDERLVKSIFETTPGSHPHPTLSHSTSSTSLSSTTSNSNSNSTNPTSVLAPAAPPSLYGGGCGSDNLIVDARPTINAMSNNLIGAGTENMEHYPDAKKVYLGIENIHVMRDSLNKVIEAIKDSDLTPLPPNRELLAKSGWLKHISAIMDGVSIIVKTLHHQNSHVLIHCSDGWDRTSQLSALAQLCLDPYYRTLEGFMVLVEKDWLSFGHRFNDRQGYVGSEKAFVDNRKERLEGPGAGLQSRWMELRRKAEKDTNTQNTSPVFHQFLDGVYQILRQSPKRFEFRERFLRRLLYHSYSCQYGSFLYNNERERHEANLRHRTRSVWDYFLARRSEWMNPSYVPEESGRVEGVIVPEGKGVVWWAEGFGRKDEEMNVMSTSVQSPTSLSRADTPGSAPGAYPSDGVRKEEVQEVKEVKEPLAGTGRDERVGDGEVVKEVEAADGVEMNFERRMGGLEIGPL
ncbi:phosphatases II [Saitoella complicata NRRL Y-17804]|uniref:phosphatases II n=1 Tax=Saitoella complicata (strain BCRC 22490 / CBS 7301 / JCM 7358 / NBRC 10748 / NRRL Y-17804) TaxID=698492 RepID=UPI000867E43C|nr:phosphatases II [Saitoella complicata NRRL Y-17804]ODQ50914.1 phosphatases II [Saitoella complicata NRRL Y-17804]